MNRRPTSTHRLLRHASASVVVFLATLLASATAFAKTTELQFNRLDATTLKLDGIPKEWSSGMVTLGATVKGTVGSPDLAAQVVVGYDDTHVYVGADITDDQFKPGGDRISVVLGFSGGKVNTVHLIPGTPGKSPGRALRGSTPVQGAKVIEAPRKGGWTLEAKVPWTAFPNAKTVRVGLRGAVQVHDADSSGAVESIVSNASDATFANLPAMPIAPEIALTKTLLKPKKLKGSPTHNRLANVSGSALQERVMVFGSYLVVLGPSFRSGSQFYWNDMSVKGVHLQVAECTTRDVTGDGRHEIILRKRFGKGKRFREMLQILEFGTSDTPRTIFQHEVGIQTESGRIRNKVTFLPDGKKVAVKIEPGNAKNYDAGNYNEATETAFDPLLLPWGTIASQLYKVQGTDYVMSQEKTQAPTAAPKAASSAAPTTKAQRRPSMKELTQRVYGQFRKDQGHAGAARFDVTADVAGDGKYERIVMHGNEIAVFGPGYRDGLGYAFTKLSQFTKAEDIKLLTVVEATGDKQLEIVVRGEIMGSSDVSAGSIRREIVLVFRVDDSGIRRIFAAEVGRSLGGKSVEGVIRFVGKGKNAAIVLAPGSANGWSARTYPFSQDSGPVGGMEPLLLPWGGNKPVKYRWTGSAFSR